MNPMNFGYQSPQMAPPYPNMMCNNGGYPYGYPPQTPQYPGYGAAMPTQQFPNPFSSPFPQPQPAPFIPGVTAPLEVTDKNGNTVTVQAQGFNQGGARVSQGGFNPVTGTINPPVGGQGVNPNPYTQFIGNPGYTTQQSNQGIYPYSPTPNYGIGGLGSAQNFFNSAYGGMLPQYGAYQGQNQFNLGWQQYLYNEEPSPLDLRDMIEKAVFTDEEREKINHNRSTIIGYDYYNRPIYNNANYAYDQSRRIQEQFQEARVAYQKHFTMLSRIAHAYTGETIDEEATMRRFDPVPPQPPTTCQYNPLDPANQSGIKVVVKRGDEIVQTNYDENQPVRFEAAMNDWYMAKTIANRDELTDQRNAYLENMKQSMFAQIKASHDKMIGIEPGQSYDLKTFLDNGYKLSINVAMQQSKEASRNGTTKYSTNGYRAGISQTVDAPIPITSKDDEYVSVESILKNVYDKNKMVNSILMRNGQATTITTEPVFSSEAQAHQYFLQSVQAMKEKNDAMRAVKYG